MYSIISPFLSTRITETKIGFRITIDSMPQLLGRTPIVVESGKGVGILGYTTSMGEKILFPMTLEFYIIIKLTIPPKMVKSCLLVQG